MTKIKAFILAGLVAATALFAPPVRAAALECDQLSTGLGLCLPRSGTDWDQWALSEIAAFTKINSSAAITGSTVSYNSLGWIAVNRISGMSAGSAGINVSSATTFAASSVTITGGGGLYVTYGADLGSATIRGPTTSIGTMTVQGESFSVGGSSFTVGGGSATVAYRLTAGSLLVNSSVTVNGSISAVSSSITANSFFGNGAGLTNLPASAATPPTWQCFTSGTAATYTRPTAPTPVQLEVYMKGGGGGGGGEGATGAGGTGGTTSFNSINAIGGVGGIGASPFTGGNGTTNGTGSAISRVLGGWGDTAGSSVVRAARGGGGGGGGPLTNTSGAGGNGRANSGGGGGGGWSSTTNSGGGGQEGETVFFVINTPGTTYTYTVGAGGTAGAGATHNGGVGGTGNICVKEIY